MTDFITLLECEPGRRLAKLFRVDGSVDDYDAGWLFRPMRVELAGLDDLADVIEALSSDPTFCAIRGALKAGAMSEWVPRRSKDSEEIAADFEAASHRWACLDLDASVVALDPQDPRQAIETWRATLPEGLRDAGMIFKLSAKAHLYPYLRGHAWVWLDREVDDGALRAWCAAHDFDPALAQAVQVHYTADPIFDDGVDPYAGRRIHRFAGGPAHVDFAAVPERVTPRGDAPAVAPDAGVLDVLGDAREHEGRRWFLCGALGGVWRRQLRSREWAEATITKWLSTVPGDHSAAVDWCLGAWSVSFPFDGKLSGAHELALHLGSTEWAERVARASLPERPGPPSPEFTPSVSELLGDMDDPPILRATGGQFWVRTEDGYRGPIAGDLLAVTLEGAGLGMLAVGDDGRPLTPKQIDRIGAPVHAIERTFAEAGSRYDSSDPFECKLHQGYRLPQIEPVYSERVAAWLEALAGAMLPNVLDWIALCSQKNIDRRAAALIIVGEHSTGKSLIFKALAHMWGAHSYVPLKDAAAQFNSTICESPIVCDDECIALKAGLITSEEFRERVQAHARKYEPKGREKVYLHGYTREGIAANAEHEVVIARMHSASTREAVEKRMCVVRVPDTERARAAVWSLGEGDEAAEMAAIVGHFAWLWQTHEVTSTERFAAAGGDVQAVSLAATSEAGADVWDHLATFLTGEIPATVDAPAAWVVRDGDLLALPSMIAGLLAMRGARWDAKAVGAVLRPIRVGDLRMLKIGGRVVRYWPLDWDRALALAGVDRDGLLARLP